MAGEFDLIAALRRDLPVEGERIVLGSGDDAAVVRAGGDRCVVSVDTTVDGVHARLDLGDSDEAARAFGWRALTTALSDLAAMGATAGEAYVALGAPADRAADLVPQLGAGLAEAARAHGVVIAGGDLSRAAVTFASVTVCGWLTPGQAPLTRGGAQAGDLLGLTGPIGAAGGGLLLQALGAGRPASPEASERRALRTRQLRPVPRLRAGAALRSAGAHAAIDLSDGLLADAGHIAAASGVTLAFDASAVPLAPGLAELLAEQQPGTDPLSFAQSAGEDFELLVCVPPKHRAAAATAGVTAWVGEVRQGAPGVTGLPTSAGRGGHDHFA